MTDRSQVIVITAADGTVSVYGTSHNAPRLAGLAERINRADASVDATVHQVDRLSELRTWAQELEEN